METDPGTLETETFDTVYNQPCCTCGDWTVVRLSPHVACNTLTAQDVRQLEDDHKKECSICLEDYEAGDVTRTLPACGHMYHEHCLWKWMVTGTLLWGTMSCPFCRLHIDSRFFQIFRQQSSQSSA